ncbi:ATP-dependent translocase ABCB1 [Geodia barretti]|uniref:ATP-dependent translocase ABCB1 n=1 Tax=Geodia barretti TaxID=519541 RepID=A0AA35W6U0_GEOBA|nr:ATP-dependent translocase ABCB1 [Geodia barretti]
MSSTQGTAGGEKDPRLLTSSAGPLLQDGMGGARGGETLEFQELETDSTGGTGVRVAGKGDDAESKPKAISIFTLFRFSTILDRILLFIGVICAMIHGSAFPVVMLIFGQLTDNFIDQAITLELVQNNTDIVSGCLQLVHGLDATAATMSASAITTGRVDCDAPIAIINGSTSLDEIIPDCFGDGRLCLGNSAFTDLIVIQCLIYVGIATAILVVSGLQSLLFQYVAERQIHQIRRRFYRAILRQDIGWFDANPSGELSSRLSDDVQKIEAGIGEKFSVVIQSFTTFAAAFVVSFTQEWRLTLVMLAYTPLIVIVTMILGKVTAGFTTREQKVYAGAGAVAEEVLSSIRTVFAFSGEQKEVERYTSKLRSATRLGARKGFFMGVLTGILFFLLFAMYSVAFWFGAYLISEDQLTAGKIFTVFFAILIGAFSLGQAAPQLELLQTASGAGSAIFDTIDRTPPIDVYSDEGDTLDKFESTVEFESVDFAYPTRPGVPVLERFSLKVASGQTVALVGASGSGKSTVVSLIERFYNPRAGKVLVSGRDVRSLNLKWLRSNIGVVSQEPVLFDTTIAENIAYGRENGASIEEIQAAAKSANAHDFIMELPNGYDTLAGERGVQLSGGQKQRIAIARALVRNPKILLLDEATSALDTESEKIVQEALDKAREGRTTIVIAHRLSTIQTADVIASIDQGQVVEWGTHSDLMDREGLYYELVTAQSYGADELFAQSGAGQLLALRQRSKQASESGGATSPTFHRQTGTAGQKSLVSSKKLQEKWDKEIPSAPLHRLLRLNAPEWWLITVLKVFQESRTDQIIEGITIWAVLFLVLALSSAIAIFFKVLCFAVSGDRLTLRLRQLTFRAMLRQEIGWFDNERNSTGALTTRLASDAGQVQGATGSRLSTLIETFTALILALVIAFVYSWVMTLFMVAVIPFIIAGGVFQTAVLNKNIARNKKALENAGMVAFDSIENIRTVAALGVEGNFYQQYSARINVMYRSSRNNLLVYAISYGISKSTVFYLYAIVFRFGALLVTQPTDHFAYVPFFDVFRVFIAIVFGGAAIGQASAFAPDFTKAKLSANRIFFMLDRKPLIDNYSDEGETPERVDGEIEMQDITFEYPSRPGAKVIDKMSLSVKPGQTVALVGPSGCGKSTIVSLLERFYDPESGSLTLDGSDLRDLNIRWLRSQVGLVSQEPVLFDTSIADNIRYGANFREVSDDEVVEAAKAANIHSFIESLPQGYSTNVGSKGTQLSGGQKQRIAIARALVRNPKILLLDEATSALDTESEKIVQEALDKAREGRTSIVIAHRLSTIYNADVIIVIKSGKVAEKGTHEALLRERGIYYTLNRYQMIHPEDMSAM